MKIIFVVGARPNFVKIAPLIEEANTHKKIVSVLVHTGQHYDFKMSQVFFGELRIPKPDYNLEVGSGSHGAQTARIIEMLEPVLVKEKPDLVVVVGDANSTLAGALCAAKLRIRVAHVEAGLRSFNPKMPEELNRKLIDHCSDFLFATEKSAVENLKREGIARSKIFLVGNVMIDTLKKHCKDAKVPDVAQDLKKSADYGVLTLHRAENVDDKAVLKNIVQAVYKISQKNLKIVWPVHPRTLACLQQFDLARYLTSIICIEPLGYLQMLGLMKYAKVVLTDSGGVQEETTVLRVPCVTLRTETERPVTVEIGTNIVAGIESAGIQKAVENFLRSPGKRGKIPYLWDGKTAKRIIATLLQKFN